MATSKKRTKVTEDDNELFISRGNLKRLDLKTRRNWGKRLGELIEAKEMSYADVARQLFGTLEGGGIAAKGRDRMSKYVSGRNFPDNDTIGSLAAFFEMSTRDLLGPEIVSHLKTIETDPIIFLVHANGTATTKFSGSGN